MEKSVIVDSMTMSPQTIYYHPHNLALDQRCVTFGTFFIKGNIDSSNKIYQNIDDRILDSL